MSALVPSMMRVEPVGIEAEGRGPLVDLRVTWDLPSGASYDVTVQLLTHFACASLVVMLWAGMIGPLALIALNQPV